MTSEEEAAATSPMDPASTEAEPWVQDEAVEEEAQDSDLRGRDGEPLSRDEESQVRELQERDREVRAHEEAHKAAAGDLALSGPTYDYETGPDGNDYAVGGEVQIALKPGRTPEESLRNAQRARRAALAPAEPSGQDRKVAAEAAQMEAEARAEAQGEANGGSAAGAAASTGQAFGTEPSQALRPELLQRDEAYREVGAFAATGQWAEG